MSEAFERELSSRLQALPACSPPSDGWERLQQRQRRGWSTPALAMAATLAGVAVLVAALWDQPAAVPSLRITAVQNAPVAASPNPLPTLIAQSQALEQQWRQRKVGMNQAVDTRRIQRLEEGLAMIDVQLNAAAPGSPEELALWRNRVQLMSALVASPQQDRGLRTASYEVPL
ncbi:MAG: hypothetical protein ABF271_01895 [Abyssibacter sp.]|uniref:hypothetical protein n=1 Tax=Abyssibacter sp. TaxID=2320200 RepID=UPI00321AB874